MSYIFFAFTTITTDIMRFYFTYKLFICNQIGTYFVNLVIVYTKHIIEVLATTFLLSKWTVFVGAPWFSHKTQTYILLYGFRREIDQWVLKVLVSVERVTSTLAHVCWFLILRENQNQKLYIKHNTSYHRMWNSFNV